ncbi:MAG: hypothetical protein JXR77_10815 [Lentisphaeria bacterium]|nr:hypothetical protein [Lentisphaeria bacterium]
MTVRDLVDLLGLVPLHLEDPDGCRVTSAYCGDLLSDVLAHCQPGAVWFTVQAHMNAVAVADLRDVACLVLVNGVSPDPQTTAKAQSQGINVCGSESSSAELCLRLAGKAPVAVFGDDPI